MADATETPVANGGVTPAAEVETQTGSEVVTNTETPKPSPDDVARNLGSALKETRESLKAEREAREKMQAELDAIRQNPGSLFAPSRQEEPELDPDVKSTLDTWAKSTGVLTKAELAAERAKDQAKQDLADLKAKHGLTDEQVDQVRQAAQEAGATSARGLDFAYKALFQDKIIEDKVKEAIAKGASPGASAERPGPGGGGTPSAGGSDKGKKLTMVDRIRNAAAKQASQ